MTNSQIIVTIPNVSLTLDQMLDVIRHLDRSSHIQVAKVLLEVEMDTKMTELLQRLTERKPADELPDDIIAAEIHTAREP